MARQAKLIRGFDQVGVVSGAVHVVTTETCHAAPVHDALNEIITLHAVFVAGAVGEVHEVRFTEFVLFKPPKILQVQTLMETHGPVVEEAVNRIVQWLALRMTLDAGIGGSDKIQLCGIHNVQPAWIPRVLTAWSVTSLAADIPLGDGLRIDIVIDRMAAIA